MKSLSKLAILILLILGFNVKAEVLDGKEINSNYKNINGVGYQYNVKEQTGYLKLNNYNGSSFLLSENETIITLYGNNTIDAKDLYYGLKANHLTIKGEGTLTIKNFEYGLQIDTLKLENTNLILEQNKFGIHAYTDIEMKNSNLIIYDCEYGINFVWNLNIEHCHLDLDEVQYSIKSLNRSQECLVRIDSSTVYNNSKFSFFLGEKNKLILTNSEVYLDSENYTYKTNNFEEINGNVLLILDNQITEYRSYYGNVKTLTMSMIGKENDYINEPWILCLDKDEIREDVREKFKDYSEAEDIVTTYNDNEIVDETINEQNFDDIIEETKLDEYIDKEAQSETIISEESIGEDQTEVILESIEEVETEPIYNEPIENPKTGDNSKKCILEFIGSLVSIVVLVICKVFHVK